MLLEDGSKHGKTFIVFHQAITYGKWMLMRDLITGGRGVVLSP